MTIPKQVPLHGRRAYISPQNDLVSRGAVATGGEDKPTIVLPGSQDTVAIWDDFLGDVVADEWAFVSGDTGIPAAALTTGTNGLYRISGSETQAVVNTANAALTQGLFKNWKADMGVGSMKNDR